MVERNGARTDIDMVIAGGLVQDTRTRRVKMDSARRSIRSTANIRIDQCQRTAKVSITSRAPRAQDLSDGYTVVVDATRLTYSAPTAVIYTGPSECRPLSLSLSFRQQNTKFTAARYIAPNM